MMAGMRVQVRPFSGARHMMGGATVVTVEVAPGATVDALKDALAAAYPLLRGVMSSYAIAVGDEMQDPSHILQEGDVVDLIPPISGG